MVSSSKLLTLTLSSSLLRSCRLAPTSFLSIPSSHLPGPLRFCSAATAAAVDVADPAIAAVSAGHAWPEWGDFLEKLRTKGYFERPSPPPRRSAGEGAEDGEAAADENSMASADAYPSRDQNRVKNACLRFARDRDDILDYLPKETIQAIVERGCPNIFRKAVNSAKRLRQFVHVKEEDACEACKLRGSCDKANLTPKLEPGEGARTADVVRILLSYATEPSSLSGENSVDGSVQESARKLLSKLIALSDTPIDPSYFKHVLPTSKKSKESVAKARDSVGKGRETTATEMKQGDWLCPNCNFLNFARNRRCLECKADGPKKIEAATTEMKMGDWICTQCHFMNFSSNRKCFKCEEPRPKRQLNPGEWECPSCYYVNFRCNKVCKKCDHNCPEDDTQDNHQGQRNIRGAGKNRTFDFIDREEDDDDDVSPYKGARRHLKEERGPRRTADNGRSAGFADPEGLLTAKSRMTAKSRRGSGKNRTFDFIDREEDDDDDVSPYKGARRHLGSMKEERGPEDCQQQ